MRRKITKTGTRGANTEERAHMRWIKEESCMCAACLDETPMLIAHHSVGSTFKHNKVLIGHWFVLGLCEHCDAIITSGSKRIFSDQFGAQCDLWAAQIKRYIMSKKASVPFEVHHSIMDWGI